MLPKSQIILPLLLFASILNGQVKTTMTFSLTEFVCSPKYIFDDLGHFYIRDACEGHSVVSFGAYQLKHNKIILDFQNIDTTAPFLRITESKAKNDTAIKVSFKDRFNNAISGNDLRIDAIDTSGHFFKEVMLDDNGAISIDPGKYRFLRLGSTYTFYGKWLMVALDITDKEIIMNLPREFFFTQYRWVYKGKTDILTLKHDGLYNATGEVKLGTADQ